MRLKEGAESPRHTADEMSLQSELCLLLSVSKLHDFLLLVCLQSYNFR